MLWIHQRASNEYPQPVFVEKQEKYYMKPPLIWSYVFGQADFSKQCIPRSDITESDI